MEDLTTFRTAAYYRLSKEDAKEGNEESNSIQTQKKLIAGYIERHSEFLLTMEICDDGYSGLHMDRPGIKKLWEAICGGRIDCIIVKDDCVIIEPTQKDLENQGFVAGSICF